MTKNSQHKALSLKFAFAYAGTLALVASAALFPSVSAEATITSLRGLVFAQESTYVQGALRSQEFGRTSLRFSYAWVALLALIGACIIASHYRAPHAKTQYRKIQSVFRLAPLGEYLLPLIRGPSL